MTKNKDFISFNKSNKDRPFLGEYFIILINLSFGLLTQNKNIYR